MLEYLYEQKVEIVPKSENPANTPEARSSEDFWGDLKREVYKNDWTARNTPQLKARIVHCLRKIDKDKIKAYASENQA